MALLATLAAGCGGTSVPEQQFSGVDAGRLVTVRPGTPGWGWSELSGSSVPFKPHEPSSSDRSLGAAEGRWQDTAKLAHIDVSVFGSASEAHAALPAFHRFARKWAIRDAAGFTDRALEGLGDEAWRIRQGPGDFGESATVGWRRMNLVLEVHIQCIFTTCRSDVARAIRGWAESVDSAARADR
jgi:hypothetical protein